MARGSASTAPSIYPILAVNFVGALGFSIVLPFLVFLVTRLGGNAVVYGVMGATYSAFQLVGAPVLGRWSDRVGRKKVLLISQLGTLVSWGIFLVALALPVRELAAVDAPGLGAFTLTVPLVVLFLARAVDGLTGGNVSVANAYLADITTEADRSANFGKLAVSTNLGFLLGPALAGVLGATAWGESLPVLAAFVVSIVATLVIVFALQEYDPCVIEASTDPVSVRDVMGGDQKECYRIEGTPRTSTRDVLALPGIGHLLLLQFLVFLAFNVFYIAWPVYAAQDLEWSLPRLGVFFTVMGLMMAVVQGPLLSRLSKRVPDRSLVVAGSLILAFGFAAFTGRSSTTIYAGTALVALGNGMMWPSLLAVVSRSTAADVQGAVQGFGSSATAVASILGFLGGGVLFGILGNAVFLLSAGVTGIVFVLSLWIPAKPRTGASTLP